MFNSQGDRGDANLLCLSDVPTLRQDFVSVYMVTHAIERHLVLHLVVDDRGVGCIDSSD